MPHVVYDNFVLENKIENFLDTAMDMNQFITIDRSLTETAGMLKKIHKYTATGNVQEVAMGEGNDESIEVSFSEVEYRVGTTQGRFDYYDEEAMTDPMVVEVGLKKMSANMTNDLTRKAIGEMKKTENIQYGASWSYDNVVDAIASYPYESEAGLFLLINKAQKAAFRKNLKDDLKYVEANVRTGYIGTICNVPIYVSDAVPVGVAFLGTKEAVTCFVKKGVESEQERNANIRKNSIWGRKVQLVALTDETRMIKLSAVAADPREGYHKLAEEPADWATDFDDYFTFNAPEDKMEAVTGTAAPDFVAGKFWAADATE